MRISDWSSDVCSSDLTGTRILTQPIPAAHAGGAPGMMRIEISLRDVFAAQRAQALKALLLLACGLVAAGLIVWRSARRLGAPITSLAEAARRLTRGELPEAIPVTADGAYG